MKSTPYLDFSPGEYKTRLARVQRLMESAKLDALFLTMRDNVEYLSGFTTVSWRLIEKRFWLIVPRDGEPVLTVDLVHECNAVETSWVEDLRIWGKGGRSCVDHLVDIFRDLGLGKARVGMELGLHSRIHMSLGEFAEIQSRLPHVTFVNGDEWVGRARMIKSAGEIDRIARACDITCTGITTVFQSIKEGMTERELLNILVGEWLRLGADTAYTATNHGYLSLQAARVRQMTPSPVERKIQKGDLIQVDGGAVFKGYCADIYRNAFVGLAPPKRLQEYAEGCCFIQSRALQSIKPGVTSAQICAAAEEATREIGFQDLRRTFSDAISTKKGSMIGHGLGFSIHEFPLIAPTDQTEWVTGMCGALEIAFGDGDLGWIEWEDNFLVTTDGVKNLTPLAKQLWLAGA